MTQEQKDKQAFFAQYWGQTVLIAEANNGSVNTYRIQISEMYDHYFDYECYLTLKPLTSITDEDAIEVANILRFRGDNLIQNVKEFLTGNDHWLNKHVNPFTYSQVVDFLRSRGYLLPFRSFTTDQILGMGWAKLQEI